MTRCALEHEDYGLCKLEAGHGRRHEAELDEFGDGFWYDPMPCPTGVYSGERCEGDAGHDGPCFARFREGGGTLFWNDGVLWDEGRCSEMFKVVGHRRCQLPAGHEGDHAIETSDRVTRWRLE